MDVVKPSPSAPLFFATWSLPWAVISLIPLRDKHVDERANLKYSALSAGILFIVVFVIHSFGLVTLGKDKVKINFLRIYVHGSFLSALCLPAGRLVRVIDLIYHKQAHLDVCMIDHPDWPLSHCSDSWFPAEEVIFFVAELILSLFLYCRVFGYYLYEKPQSRPSQDQYSLEARPQHPPQPSRVQYPPKAHLQQSPPHGQQLTVLPPPYERGTVPPYGDDKPPNYHGI